MAKEELPTYIPVRIQKVMQINTDSRIAGNQGHGIAYAHISEPIQDQGRNIQYALIAEFPRHGVMQLGNINPETGRFVPLSPTDDAFYKRADNHVVREVSVPVEQLNELKTLDELLSNPKVRVDDEFFPED
jgi:hypothetical protein